VDSSEFWCGVVWCGAVCCSVSYEKSTAFCHIRPLTVCCSVLHCVVVCVAVCCSVLHCVVVCVAASHRKDEQHFVILGLLQYVTVYYSVLLCVWQRFFVV